MSEPTIYGHARQFRRATLLERLAGPAGRAIGTGAARRLIGRAYDAALWIATGGRGLHATLPGGELVRLGPWCRALSWNELEYRAFRDAVRPGDVVIDAGANAGAYTVLFARWTGASGRVYAFEPVPSIAGALSAQLRLNGVSDRVTVVASALGAGTGSVDLIAPGLNGINRFAGAADDSNPHRVQVPVTSIDEFCAREGIGPDVIKIDVEGAELDVLRGARKTIASSRDLRLFVEWHPSLWPNCGASAGALREELGRQGLQAEPLRAGDDVWRVEGVCARLTRRQ